MEVDVLGPVQARVRGRSVELAGHQRRALLSALALRPGEVVRISRLVDALWDADPPASAVVKVQGHVSALRRAIADAGHSQPRTVVVTRPPGYLLDLAESRLDVARFDTLVRAAERSRRAGKLAEASELFGEALVLWRGPAFADVPSRSIQAEAVQLEERRLLAVEAKAELDVSLGRYPDVVAQLYPLVAANPLRESLRAQLMIALYRNGRQASALEVYREGRRILVDELGIEPGPQLRRLETQILAGGSATAAAQATMLAPCDLPRDPSHFTGREREVRQLRDLLADPAGAAVANITGPAGAGKTTLAVRVAHEVQHRFPDGRLYVDLRSGERGPVRSAEALSRFLRTLGMPGHVIPEDEGARADLYRALVADRQLLVVLDNAANEQQVRPLLPGGPRCATLITSRRALSGLDLTALVGVGMFEEEAAGRLFVTVSGAQDAPAAELDRVLGFCGGLPLAVRVAAARLAARPYWTAADLADRLADERNRLHELTSGDLDVRASLTLSYDHLDEPARLAFRLLALAGEAPISTWRLAALLDRPPAVADRILQQLVEIHLLEPHGRDTGGSWTYRMHSLVRLFAAELLARPDPEAGEPSESAEPAVPSVADEALRRLLASQLVLAEAAEEKLLGPIPHLGRGSAPRYEVDPELRRRLLADPLAWFEAERRHLVAGVEAAAVAGMTELAANLACATIGFLLARSHWDDAYRVLNVAMRSEPDPLMAVHLYRARAELAAHRGDLHAAARSLDEVAEQLGALGDRRAECYTRWSLAQALRAQCRFDEARRQLDLAMDTARQLGDRRAEGMVLATLAQIEDLTGRSGAL
ncbi:MAG TPA: BTAD domain-containing putative transcriptional regulator [Pseudonocardiaceae bacterium]|nr:BTAD domain-containing putative transcriptional regulator [Pseudonocardiaceae bacterium]